MPMTDEQLGQLIASTMEADVVRRLMAGNDAQCFTTEQYQTMRDEWIAEMCGSTRDSLGMPEAPIEYARNQLRGFPPVVEVSPDVWTLRSLIDPTPRGPAAGSERR